MRLTFKQKKRVLVESLREEEKTLNIIPALYSAMVGLAITSVVLTNLVSVMKESKLYD